MTLTLLALVQLFGAAIGIWLAVFAYRRREQPGIIWLVVVLVGDVVWMITAGLNYATTSFTVSATLLQIRYVGITIIPVALLFFALEYTGYDEWLTPGRRVLISLPALGALLLALTDDLHGRFYANVTAASTPQHVAYEYGLIAVPWIAYAFVLSVVAVGAFVRYAVVADHVYRWQAITLAGAISIGIVADVLFFLPVPPNGFAITPLGILLTSAIAVGIIVRYDFVRLIPATRELGRKELIERMELGMVVVDADGRVVDVNPSAARILGREPVALLGEQAPDVLPSTDGSTVAEHTFTIDGVDRDVEIRTSRVGTESGSTLITLQELEDFTGMISHDLQGPLMEIRGSADLAINTGDIEHVDQVLGAANRIDELVTDLVQLAHTGRQLEAQSPVDLGELANRAWMHVWTPNADLSVETHQTIIGDPDRIRQLLENVFRNSVEHGASEVNTGRDRAVGHERSGQNSESRDGESAEAQSEPLQVTIGPLEDGFYIEDTGCGFPVGERERIFEKGYTNSPSGTGLGLSIVHKVVGVHGWSVRATEGATGGARLEFTGVELVDELYE
ncbi:histidine kinase N-terminal 7TM domain-containing protein [Natronosalvus vescus]|uniref:histidine kinase N-terminal 7TM domain-containing protein n=1 Tax=Natronosalvus vescus TaxID=2953881 RepID=UPI0020905B01|nr:histidine kinase N-terminal 7TM domain-containing protein [Natronosalvus vescus]